MKDDLISSLEPLHRDAYGWALHCCEGAAAEAGDVLQNAYLKVIQGKAICRDLSSLKTWWFGVIRFTAKEESRRRRFRESLAGKLLRFPSYESTGGDSAVAYPLDLDESARNLRLCLEQLPARQAEVLHLVFYQDLSLSEAAGVMGVSLGSARTHYARAKTRLRELLQFAPLES